MQSVRGQGDGQHPAAPGFDDFPAQRADCLVAGEQYGAFRSRNVGHQVVLDAAPRAHPRGGHDDAGPLVLVQLLGLFRVADELEAGEAEEAGAALDGAADVRLQQRI